MIAVELTIANSDMPFVFVANVWYINGSYDFVVYTIFLLFSSLDEFQIVGCIKLTTIPSVAQ